MNRRRFVFTSSVMMLILAGAAASLAFYTHHLAQGFYGLPDAVRYLPADSQGVFGVNVREFINSSFYGQLEARHGGEIGSDLQEFVAKTGVDPRKDIDYIVAAVLRSGESRGGGVAIAVGTHEFNSEQIKSYIYSHCVPIEVDYHNAQVLMIPEHNGDRLEKGIAFLGGNMIALGDLETLKKVIDVQSGVEGAAGIESNSTLAPLIGRVNTGEMFWFAGDAQAVLSKAPANAPFAENLSSVQTVFGTLNINEEVIGTIVATTRDPETAGKLADVARGFKALGQLASDQNPELTSLMAGIDIFQEDSSVTVKVNFPTDILEKLRNGDLSFRNR